MIGYLDGKIVRKADGVIVVEISGVGYEVSLPAYVEYQLKETGEGDNVKLHILYYHPSQQPAPKLYGFCSQVEREFFEDLMRVDGIGPSVAVDIFSRPVSKIAKAIAESDTKTLRQLKKVGEKTAEKIVAELRRRATKFALMTEDGDEISARTVEDVKKEVIAALTDQLGHTRAQAQSMVENALRRNSDISTAEDLFEEVYRGQKG